jgi:hypothetical protein
MPHAIYLPQAGRLGLSWPNGPNNKWRLPMNARMSRIAGRCNNLGKSPTCHLPPLRCTSWSSLTAIRRFQPPLDAFRSRNARDLVHLLPVNQKTSRAYEEPSDGVNCPSRCHLCMLATAVISRAKVCIEVSIFCCHQCHQITHGPPRFGDAHLCYRANIL